MNLRNAVCLLLAAAISATVGASGQEMHAVPGAKQAQPSPQIPRLSQRALPELPVTVIGPDSLVSFFSHGRLQSQVQFPPSIVAQIRQGKQPPVLRIPNSAQISPAEVCYSIRGYVFAREKLGDATRLVATSTCTPASKFTVKQAIAKPRQ